MISNEISKQNTILSQISNLGWTLPEKVLRDPSRILFDPSEKRLPTHLRVHCTVRLENMFIPFAFQRKLMDSIEEMIYEGYQGRSPFSPVYKQKLRQQNFLDNLLGVKFNASGGSLIGVSGLGKSKTIETVLDFFSQVIRLGKNEGFKVPIDQLVWLRLDCIHDGSLRELCRSIVRNVDGVLGTCYVEYLPQRCSTERLLSFTSRLLYLHGLGILVIDEIQHLLQANEIEQDKTFAFLSSLIKNVGIPVLLIGTPKAHKLMQTKFLPLIRGCDTYKFLWDRMPLGEEWVLLCKSLVQYQWTEDDEALSPEFVHVLYEESIGIPAIAVRGYILAQKRAINLRLSKVTCELIRHVMKDSMQLIQPMVVAIREGIELENGLSDLIIPMR